MIKAKKDCGSNLVVFWGFDWFRVLGVFNCAFVWTLRGIRVGGDTGSGLKLKYPLRETRRKSIEAIKRNSLKELKAIPTEAYKKCMENWINQWHACIGSKRAYFEGDNKDLY